MLPGVRDETGASEAGLGAALLFVGAGALPAMLLAGVLVDRRGSLVAPALVAFAATILLPGFAGSIAVLAACLAVVGMASGALDVVANAAIASLEAATGRRLMQAAHALFSAGVVAGSVSAGLAREAGASPRHALVATAVLVALAAAANRGGSRQVPAANRRPGLVFSPVLVLLGVLCAVAFVFESGVESWSAVFLEDELGASPATSGLGPGTFAAAMALGRLFGQTAEVRLGDRPLLAGGLAASAVGVLAASAAQEPFVALAGFALAGAGVAVAAPVFFGTAGRVCDESVRGGAVAAETTISYLGFLAGPALMGGVAGGLGLRAAWVMLAGIAAALSAAVLVLALPLRGRSE